MKRGIAALAVCSIVLAGGCSAGSTLSKVKDLASGKTAKEIEDFQKKAEAAQKLTYTAEYDSVSPGNKTEKIKVAQKPPKSRYEQGDSLVIDTGSRTVTCSPDNGKQQCLDVGPSGSGALGFTQLLNAPALLGTLSVLAIVPGVSVSHPGKSLAGENLDCVKISVAKENKSVESCVTKDGVLGFYDSGDGNTFTLTKFSRSASDKDFEPPTKPQTTQDLINQATSTSVSISIPTTITLPEPTTTTSEDTTTTTESTTTSSG